SAWTVRQGRRRWRHLSTGEFAGGDAYDLSRQRSPGMADGGGGFMAAVQARVEETLDACTRCGQFLEALPMVGPAGLDPANAVAIVEGTLDLLSGGPGTADAERWAEVC